MSTQSTQSTQSAEPNEPGGRPWVLALTIQELLEAGDDPRLSDSLRDELIAYADSVGVYEADALTGDLRRLGSELVRAGELLVRHSKHAHRRLRRAG